MKITRNQLRRLIKEELSRALLEQGEWTGTQVKPTEPGRMDVSDQMPDDVIGNYVVEISGSGESAVAYITDPDGETVSGGVNWNPDRDAGTNLGMLQIRDAIEDHRVTRRWDGHWAPV